MYSLKVDVFMYKCSINYLPKTFIDYFTKPSNIHGYQTRHVNDLNKTKQTNKQTNKNHFSDHTVQTTGHILWNSLDKTSKAQTALSNLGIIINKILSQIIVNFFV